MQPRFSIQIVAVISLSLTVVTIPMTAIDCADWNSKEYFEAAAAADVTDCIQSGADLKARTKGGLTPLHFTASTENPAVITVLLDAGADPKARDMGGKTPWDYAKDREPLKGSDAYWRLNETQY